MLQHAVSLEVSKQKKQFIGAVLLVLMLLLIVLAEAFIRGRNVSESVSAMVTFLSIGVIPVIAVLFGCTAASGLRNASNLSAEEPLPLSSTQRTAAAYVASLIYFLSAAVSLLLLGFLFSGKEITEAVKTVLIVPFGFNPYQFIAILSIIHLHFLAFFFSYWRNQPFLGAGIAIVITASEIYLAQRIAWISYFLSEFSRFADYRWLQFVLILIGMIAVATSIAAFRMITPRVERGRRTVWVPAITSLFLILALPFSLFIWTASIASRLNTQLHPIFYSWWHVAIKEGPYDMERLTRSAIFSTVSNSMVRITPDSRTVLFRSDPQSLLEVNMGYYSSPRMIDHFIQRDGTIWMLIQRNEDRKQNNNVFEILRSAGNEPFRLHLRFSSPEVWPTFLMKRGDELCLYGQTERMAVRFATIRENQKTLEWIPVHTNGMTKNLLLATTKHRLEPAAQAGLIAELSNDRTKLTQELPGGSAREWILPGEGVEQPNHVQNPYIYPPVQTPEGRAFSLAVVQDKTVRIAFCSPDGSVSFPWNKTWQLSSTEQASNILHRRIIPGGGVAWFHGARWAPHEIFVIGPDGTPYPPIQMKNIQQKVGATDQEREYSEVTKFSDGNLWITTFSHLVRIDLRSGSIVQVTETGENRWGASFSLPTEEGIYFTRDGEIRLAGWDGKITTLGPATLN